MNQYPQVGDVCVPGVIAWCQEMPGFYAQKGVHVFCGQVRASADLYFCPAAGDPNFPGYDPCIFPFTTFNEGFDPGVSVFFDVTTGKFAPVASNIVEILAIENLAEIVAHLAEHTGHAAAAAELRKLTADLWS